MQYVPPQFSFKPIVYFEALVVAVDVDIKRLLKFFNR